MVVTVVSEVLVSVVVCGDVDDVSVPVVTEVVVPVAVLVLVSVVVCSLVVLVAELVDVVAVVVGSGMSIATQRPCGLPPTPE